MRTTLCFVLTFVFCLTSQAEVFIRAEETPHQILKVSENMGYFSFETCEYSESSLLCTPLLKQDTSFSRSELAQLSEENSRNAWLKALAIPLVLVVAVKFGVEVGIIAGSMMAYQGQALALFGFTYGILPSTAAATIVVSTIDYFDFFIDKDISYTFDSITEIASEKDLAAIEANITDGNLYVTVEDLNFKQLKSRVASQLTDLKNKRPNQVRQKLKIFRY